MNPWSHPHTSVLDCSPAFPPLGTSCPYLGPGQQRQNDQAQCPAVRHRHPHQAPKDRPQHGKLGQRPLNPTLEQLSELPAQALQSLSLVGQRWADSLRESGSFAF